MYNHAPKNYECPFCGIAKMEENSLTGFKKEYLVYADKQITAFMSSMKWPKCVGVVIIIPNKHYENIYDIPDKLISKIAVAGKKIAIAMKKGYKCDAVSTRQHNEPAGNQSVWHYHFQVMPRYANDNLYTNHKKKTSATDKERIKFAKMLRKFLGVNS